MDPKKAVMRCRNGHNLAHLREVLGVIRLHRSELGIWAVRRPRAGGGRRLPLLRLSGHRARREPCEACGDSPPRALVLAGGCRIRDAATWRTCCSMDSSDRLCLGQSLSGPRYARRPQAAVRVSSSARKDLVSFDEIGVVAVHRTDKIAHGPSNDRIYLTGEGAGLRGQLKGDIF